MAASIARKKAFGIGFTDAVAVLFVLAVPALSHLTPVPFYLLDPMRLAVLGALLASRSRVNGLVLAAALPLISFAVSGHPVFPKYLIIAAELSVNVLLFVWLEKVFAGRRFGVGIAAFASILLSKAFYYGLKALVLGAGLMQMELVSTALWVQLVVAVLIYAGFAIIWRSDRSW